jgi:hypothetical protein
MKKLTVLLVVMFASITAGQAQGWAFGGRVGSGISAVGQRHFFNGNYIEGRVGMGWIHGGGITADIGAMHVWNIQNMYWTDEGRWFFDLGAGGNLSGANDYMFAGVMGMAKLGYTFEDAPVSISVDWSPTFGPEVYYIYVDLEDSHHTFRASDRRFNARGIANIGVSCVYRF